MHHLGTRRAHPLAVAAVLAVSAALVAAGVGPAWAQTHATAGSSAPRAHVSLTKSRTVPTGAHLRLAGRVTPSKAGRTVRLQVRRDGAFHTVVTDRLGGRSAYSFHLRFVAPGPTRLRVLLPHRPGQPRAVSRVRTITAVPPGYDVGYPQCGGALPAGATFGVVGVDGGRPFDVNPCLAEQIAWAVQSGRPTYYVNTANPGHRLSTHWPTGQRTPQPCRAGDPSSTACSYDYGWNAAKDSFDRASTAASLAGAPAVQRSAWWLDVELQNTWEAVHYRRTAQRLTDDKAVLHGMRAYLRTRGVHRVGVYSTAHQWVQITGGTAFHRAPVWYAGVAGPSQAAKRCARDFAFTGGTVRMTQFARGGFDADHRC